MPDPAQVNRSLGSVRTELEFLRDSGVLAPQQFQSIMAQLPGQNGQQSTYFDPKFAGGQDYNHAAVAQQAQDPNHAANPKNPKHHEWVKGLASKFGNAAMFGAGATFGGDMVNDALKHF